MRIAVVPARGGSKRIPRKNVKLFHGRPMIAWSIAAARHSGCFDRIVVSTDDEEIAEISRRYGAETPFMRPAELADDFCGTNPVVAHAIRWHIDAGCTPEHVCCVYATAPFLRSDDLRRGLELLIQSGAEYAFGVTSYAFPIQRALKLSDDKRVEMVRPENFYVRSQDLDEYWHDAGQFYWGSADSWLRGTSMFSRAAVAVPLPRYRVQDIDSLEDWRRAELMFAALLKMADNEQSL